ncbi:MAG TPA: SIMPL domain-containing protein [Bryobacteraceae bacterium]|nr:SIMPL domain-containing protein [Bryobacteraceae bacterium]
MPRFWLVVLMLWGGHAFAQSDTDTFTVTAARQVNLQPDQIVFGVEVQSGLDSGFDQVFAALASSGIDASDFSSVTFQLPGRLVWEFTLPAPLSKMRDTVAMLSALQQAVAKGQGGLSLSFRVRGSQVSQEAQAAACSNAALISDAQSQAQAMANAAGFTAGPILSISKAGSLPSSATAAFNGSFLLAVPVLFLVAEPAPLTCSATVKFRLYRYH